MKTKLINLKSIAAITLMFLLQACGGGGGGGSENDGSGSSGSNNSVGEYSTSSDSTGAATFSFSVPSGTTGFQAVTTTDTGVLRLVSITDPAGVQVVNENTTDVLTNAVDLQWSPNTVRFPLLTEPVKTGAYTFNYKVTSTRGASIAGATVQLNTVMKSDSTPRNGTLAVNMVLVGPATDSPDLRDDLEKIVSIWQQIYDNAGITLDVAWSEFAGPSNLPDPAVGASLYSDISKSLRQNALNVVIGSTVSGLDNQDFIFGRYGAISGPAIPSSRSAVVLSLLRLTGGDGIFDYTGPQNTQVHNDEKRLAAEEIAQLAGHYLGLQHTVEFSSGGSRATSVDLLSDTRACATATACRNDKLARSNFMFPFPLSKLIRDPEQNNQFREYYARDAITDQQRAMLNSAVLVQ